VPGVTDGTTGTLPPWFGTLVESWETPCRPARETAVAPVPRPIALLKVRLLIM
jgi:hypothetical protein